jgi:hypothetical protein
MQKKRKAEETGVLAAPHGRTRQESILCLANMSTEDVQKQEHMDKPRGQMIYKKQNDMDKAREQKICKEQDESNHVETRLKQTDSS